MTNEKLSPPSLTDYRVLYQYNNVKSEDFAVRSMPDVVRKNFGPTFGFTTIMAKSPEEAAREIEAIHAGYDDDFSIVQVVEANEFETGFKE